MLIVDLPTRKTRANCPTFVPPRWKYQNILLVFWKDNVKFTQHSLNDEFFLFFAKFSTAITLFKPEQFINSKNITLTKMSTSKLPGDVAWVSRLICQLTEEIFGHGVQLSKESTLLSTSKMDHLELCENRRTKGKYMSCYLEMFCNLYDRQICFFVLLQNIYCVYIIWTAPGPIFI